MYFNTSAVCAVYVIIILFSNLSHRSLSLLFRDLKIVEEEKGK